MLERHCGYRNAFLSGACSSQPYGKGIASSQHLLECNGDHVECLQFFLGFRYFYPILKAVLHREISGEVPIANQPYSNGHGCMLQYALLHLAGFPLSIDDLKNFRVRDTRSPDSPETPLTLSSTSTASPLVTQNPTIPPALRSPLARSDRVLLTPLVLLLPKSTLLRSSTSPGSSLLTTTHMSSWAMDATWRVLPARPLPWPVTCNWAT